MTTIELNNQSKTQFTFSYSNNLPYKKCIRPEVEYGNWAKDNSKTLIKVILKDEELILFNDPYNINGLATYLVNNEIWFDLEDVYLVIPSNSYLQSRLEKMNILLGFIYNKELISSLSMK